MPNLDQKFYITGDIDDTQKIGIQQVLGELDGVNHTKLNIKEKNVTVGYTPGIINIQQIKEAIESKGVDVSDKGDD